MGRGGYNGGSTIISAWGSGWSHDAVSPKLVGAKVLKSQTKKKKRKKMTATKLFELFCHECGVQSSKYMPWGNTPKGVLEHFDNNHEAIKQAILKSPAYGKGVESQTKNTRAQGQRRKSFEASLKLYARQCGLADLQGRAWEAAPKKIRTLLGQKTAGFRGSITSHESYNGALKEKFVITERGKEEFAERAAIAFFDGKKLPPTPSCLFALMTDEKLQEFISNIDSHPTYHKTLKSCVQKVGQEEKRNGRAEKMRERQRQKMEKIVVEKKRKRHMQS